MFGIINIVFYNVLSTTSVTIAKSDVVKMDGKYHNVLFVSDADTCQHLQLVEEHFGLPMEPDSINCELWLDVDGLCMQLRKHFLSGGRFVFLVEFPHGSLYFWQVCLVEDILNLFVCLWELS